MADVNVGPDNEDLLFTSEQRTTDRALRFRATGEADALHALYKIADAKLNAELADKGYLPKREAVITIRIEVLAELATATLEVGVASSRGYCYACPSPIGVGDGWRRERIGTSVPHAHRLVHHPACPPAPGDRE